MTFFNRLPFDTENPFRTFGAVRLLLALVSFAPVNAHASPPLQPTKLSCDYLENPLSIASDHPSFSWQIISTKRNLLQSAYEIMVSDNIHDLEKRKGSFWTTGKVASNRSTQIKYNGKALRSFTRYYWSVRVYGQEDAASAWSAPAWFETAMLHPQDWSSAWIGDGSIRPARDEDYYQKDPMPLFRKPFSTKKKPVSARLYITGLGYFEAWLNGRKVGDHLLDPGFTKYSKQVQYVSFDITEMVTRGQNIVGVMSGNGWWNPLPIPFFGRWDLRDYQQTGRPCVRAEIVLRFDDGSLQKIVTDSSWETAPGPVIHNSVYLGEHYDAGLEQPDWTTKANTSAWKRATLVTGPGGLLCPQLQPAIKVTKRIRPISITERGRDTFLVDMGQNFAGVASIKVSGKAGTKIGLRYGETLFPDGSINLLTAAMTQIKKGAIKGGPGAPETAWQEDGYTLSGRGVETWAPRFTFHGFRYVEITGWPGKPALDDIEGLRMNSDLPLNGSFACSDDMFNKLHDIIQWTFLSNVFSVQSDCPGREKMGYGADMVASCESYLYNYSMAQFYRKSITDFRNDQQPDGGITEIAPFTGIADKGLGGFSGPLGWQLAFPYLQKKLYDFYGDKEILEINYPALTKQIAFLESKATGGLFYWDIGDHEALDPKAESFSASAFYYHHLSLAAEIAGILGKADDSLKFDKTANQVRRAIVQKYLIPNTGRFDNATQAAQLFALWYGFSPDTFRTFSVLTDEFARHDWHLSTGIFSTKMLFDVLREEDKNELAYRIASQQDYPGWGYMLKKGATTLWECWKDPGTVYSLNHPMFGSIDEWFYRSLLGINAGTPGFKTIIIKPQPVNGLRWAKGSYESIMGSIGCAWQLDSGQLQMKVIIPPNTTASVWVPSQTGKPVFEAGKEMQVARREKGYAVIEVGSGEYEFRTSR